MARHLGEQRVRRVACRILEHPLEQRVENLSIDRPGGDARPTQVVPVTAGRPARWDPRRGSGAWRLCRERTAAASGVGSPASRQRRPARQRHAQEARRRASGRLRASQRRTCESARRAARQRRRSISAPDRLPSLDERRRPAASRAWRSAAPVSVRRTVGGRDVEEQRRDAVRRPLGPDRRALLRRAAARRAWRGPRRRAGAAPARARRALRRRATAAARATGARTCSIVFTISCCTRSCESRVRCGADFADRRQRRRLDREVVSAGEADRAQRAQPILAHPLLGVAHRAHEPPLDVVASAERIAQLARLRAIGDRVDREVAAREILVEARAELHDGMSPVRLHVAAEGRDLVMDPGVVQHARPCRTRSPPGSCAGDRRSRAPAPAWRASRDPSRAGAPPSSASRIAPPTHQASKPAASRLAAISSTLSVG